MLRIWTWAWLWSVLGLLCTGQLSAQAVRPSETLLPNTTVGFIAVPNWDHLQTQWNKTQLGQLMADPVMEPFSKDLRRQFEDRWSSLEERLGLTPEDLEGVPGGEVGLARILPAPHTAAAAIVIDVTGHLPQAGAMLEKVAKKQAQQGAKRTVLNLTESPDPVIRFDLPESEDNKPQQTFYCLTGNLLAVSDRLEDMRGILARAAGKKGDSLADVQAFQVVMQRCAEDTSGATPQIRWFVHPLDYWEASLAAAAEDRRKGESQLRIFRNQGFAGVKGMGGYVDCAVDGYEILHRTAVYAPPPYQKAMKMLVFPNAHDFAPQDWIPRDIATYSTFYTDIQNAFDNFDPLFDELFGEGETGIWQEVLESLEKDPNGPQINLRDDLIRHLGRRVTVITDYELPITPASERLLFAVQAEDPAKVAETIKRTMETDESAVRRVIGGHLIWEIVEEEGEGTKVPKVKVRKLPSLIDDEEDEDDEEEDERLLPHAAVTVAYGHLLVASHLDFLLKVLKPRQPREVLGRAIALRRVDAAIKAWGDMPKCAQIFSRSDEEYRPTYELIRQGKMPQSESLLGRLLNSVFGTGKKGVVRRQRIDGQKLPDYDVVRRHLGPNGMAVTSEPNGWFLKGFLLKRE